MRKLVIGGETVCAQCQVEWGDMLCRTTPLQQDIAETQIIGSAVDRRLRQEQGELAKPAGSAQNAAPAISPETAGNVRVAWTESIHSPSVIHRFGPTAVGVRAGPAKAMHHRRHDNLDDLH